MPDHHRCRIDGNEIDNVEFAVKEMMLGTKDQFTYFQCSRCGCLQIASFPDNISDYYPTDGYYSFNESAKPRYSGVKGELISGLVRANTLSGSHLNSFIKSLFPLATFNFLFKKISDTNVRILDVGSGDGMRFLYPLFEAGFHNIMGCDPFITESLIYPNGLKVVRSELSDVEGDWEVICFNHSFEHIWNPRETLAKVNKLLTSDGLCIIRIPTASSYAWEHYGPDWFQLDAPRHYFLHTVESIKYLASQTGFELEEVKYDSTHHQFTISERYKAGKTLKERTYQSLLGKIPYLFRKLGNIFRARQLNKKKRGDQAIFYLRRK